MTQFLRRIKLLYIIYNFFHKKQLVHNLPLYQKLGLKKKYYSSVSSRDFIGLEGENINKTTKLPTNKDIPEPFKQAIATFDEKGYCILPNFFSNEEIEEVNNDIDQLLKDKQVSFRYGNKIMFAYRKSNAIRSFGENKLLVHILSYLLQNQAVLFQSINFLTGSEQATHSDSIHMTTFPLGGLIAVWIALEDIHKDNGLLHYYPGSHKLPYYLNADYDNEGNRWLNGNKGYAAYEAMIAQKLVENQYKKEVFLAKKGDILIWHANLLHGGEPHKNKSLTRKSLVFHYFNKNAICYHEITQRPALMEV